MLAHDAKHYALLAEHLHAVRFSHAFPAKTGSPRPEAVPLSMTRVPGTDMLFNALNAWSEIEQPEPAFDVDSKESEGHAASSCV